MDITEISKLFCTEVAKNIQKLTEGDSGNSIKSLKKTIHDVIEISERLLKALGEPKKDQKISDDMTNYQLSFAMKIKNDAIEKQINEVDIQLEGALEKIKNFPNLEPYVCRANNYGCGCSNIGQNAYETYMSDGNDCHQDERSILLEDKLKKEDIFQDLSVSLEAKNTRFMELYVEYGISESRFYNSDELYDYSVEEACLKIKKEKVTEIWPNLDKVLEYHFRNLTSKPQSDLKLSALGKKRTSLNRVNREMYRSSYLPKIMKIKQTYLKYLKEKCEKFLKRKVWFSYGEDNNYIEDNFVPIDGAIIMDADDISTIESLCSSENGFIKSYFAL